jgi:hypothetical protein
MSVTAKDTDGEDNIYDALLNIIYKMEDHIKDGYDDKLKKYVKWISNPTNEAENFADRWAIEGSKREQFFNDWLAKLKADFGGLGNNLNRMNLNESLIKSFGEAPVTKTFSDLGNRRKVLTESGGNYIDRKQGVVGAAVAGLTNVAKVSSHNFHGNEQS